MVDHETGGVPQAVRAEARAVPVARHHQEVDVLGNGDDLPLGPAPAVEELGAFPPEPPCRGVQEVRGRLVADFVGLAPGFVPGKGSSEKGGGRRPRDLVYI